MLLAYGHLVPWFLRFKNLESFRSLLGYNSGALKRISGPERNNFLYIERNDRIPCISSFGCNIFSTCCIEEWCLSHQFKIFTSSFYVSYTIVCKHFHFFFLGSSQRNPKFASTRTPQYEECKVYVKNVPADMTRVSLQ